MGILTFGKLFETFLLAVEVIQPSDHLLWVVNGTIKGSTTKRDQSLEITYSQHLQGSLTHQWGKRPMSRDCHYRDNKSDYVSP